MRHSAWGDHSKVYFSMTPVSPLPADLYAQGPFFPITRHTLLTLLTPPLFSSLWCVSAGVDAEGALPCVRQ